MRKKLERFIAAVPRWAQPFVGLICVIVFVTAWIVLVCLFPVWLPLLIGWTFWGKIETEFGPEQPNGRAPTNNPGPWYPNDAPPPAPPPVRHYDRSEIDR